MGLVGIVLARSEVVAAVLVVDVADLDVLVVAGTVVVAVAGWEGDLMVALLEVERMEKLAGKTDVPEWPQQAMALAETFPCAFELQASLPPSDQICLLAWSVGVLSVHIDHDLDLA